MSRLTQDVRYAIRLLRRSPGFTLTATLTFALAIGANAAIFGAVKGVLIAPLPYADPDRLVRLFEDAPTFPHFAVAPADFRDYRAELQTFDGLAAYMRADLQLGDRDRPEHLRDMPWHERAVPAIYFPQAQTWYPQTMFLIVRSSLDPSSMVEPIRRALREIDPELPLANVRPLESVAGAAIGTRRLTLWLVGAFGLTALFLAVVGIYGVMAQAVAQRNHEFGVRQALGATRAEIMRLVFSSGAVMTLAGLVGGVALAFATTRLLTSMLYGVRPFDLATFAAVAFVLVAAAAGAVYLPARRATRVSAATALHATE